MQTTPKLGRLHSGQIVYDRSYKPILTHKSPEILKLLPAVFSRISSNGERRIARELAFQFQTGLAYSVETSGTDSNDIYYARTEDNAGYSRFVKDREPEPTNSLVAIFLEISSGDYILIALYPGRMSEPEPWQYRIIKEMSKEDPIAANKSWSFWRKHAFVEGYKKIVESTKTQTCPWAIYMA